MIRFRHRGCHTEVIRYVGKANLTPLTRIERQDWQLPGGKTPERGQILPKCQDCGESLAWMDAARLEPIPETTTA